MGFIKNLFKDEEEDTTKGSENDYYNLTEQEALKEAEKVGNKMLILEPRAFSEAKDIADHLKNRNTVVVVLKRVTSDQAKRVIDFLSGVTYAIGGSMQKIGVGIYLVTPRNVTVQGKVSDEEDKEKSNKKNDEELDW